MQIYWIETWEPHNRAVCHHLPSAIEANGQVDDCIYVVQSKSVLKYAELTVLLSWITFPVKSAQLWKTDTRASRKALARTAASLLWIQKPSHHRIKHFSIRNASEIEPLAPVAASLDCSEHLQSRTPINGCGTLYSRQQIVPAWLRTNVAARVSSMKTIALWQYCTRSLPHYPLCTLLLHCRSNS